MFSIRILLFSKLLPIVVACVLISCFAGCTALKKPLPGGTPEEQAAPSAPPATDTMPSDPAEVKKIAEKVSSAVVRVPGVNAATVVVAGTTAYVGIDQKAGPDKNETERIKSEVAGEARKAEPRLTAVYVSSDPDVVTRIKKIADGIATGRPVSAFDSELAEIAKRLSPAVY